MNTRMALVLTLCIAANFVYAADHENLEEGLPTEVEDAYPTSYLNREVQFLTRYQHNKNDTDQVLFRPILEYGIWHNTELEVESDILAGNADRTGSGDVSVKGLYNFNTESLWWPAFAVSAGLTAPSGKDNEGLDTQAKFIMTKTVYGLHRVHFNLLWRNNDEPESDERSNRYSAIFGYSFPLNADTIFVTDFVREQDRKEDEDSNLVEFGVRYKLTPRSVLATGLGFGLGDDSPDLRASLGFQYSF